MKQTGRVVGVGHSIIPAQGEAYGVIPVYVLSKDAKRAHEGAADRMPSLALGIDA